VAVGLFLEKRLGFLDIAAVVEDTLTALAGSQVPDLDAVLELDRSARHIANCRAANRAAA
jgi:1-deoxy-D-xylulose-5-phosphate reductoisomerase